MIARIQSLFSLPEFSTEDQKRLASLLHPLLWGGFFIGTLFFIGNLLIRQSLGPFFQVELGILLLHLLGLALLHRRVVYPTAYLYATGLWMIMFATTIWSSGVSGSGVATLLTVTLITGFLLGTRSAFYFALLGTFGIVAVANLQRSGQLPSIASSGSEKLDALVIISNVSLVVLVIWLEKRSLQHSISEASASKSLLLERNIRLEAAAEIAALATSISDLDKLLQSIAVVLSKSFDLYHVAIFSLNREKKLITLVAESDRQGREALTQAFTISLHEKSIVANVVRTQKTYLAKDVTQDALFLMAPGLPDARSELALPIKAGEDLFGVLDVISDEEEPLTWDEVTVLKILANLVGAAIQNARLRDAQQRHLSELQALHSIATAGVEATTEDDLILRATRVVGESLFSSNFGVLLIDYRSGQLIHHQSYAEKEAEPRPPIPLGEGITGLVALSGEPMLINDVSLEPRYISVDSKARSELCVPIKIGTRVLGVLNVESHEANAFDEADEQLLLAFAGQLAIAMEKIRLLSETRSRADELAQALERQEELSRLKSEFIQNVSHEFRTPLAIVSGYAEILDSEELGALSDQQKEPIHIIARRTALLSKLVDDLTSIIEVEGREQNFERIVLPELIETMLPRIMDEAGERKLTVTTDFDPSALPVLGEPTFLKKAIDNLLTNAIKFTPPGGEIFIRVKADRGKTLLEIEDTGIGIDASQIKHIFERFYQVDGSSTREYGGTGMGLALVREITELHKGKVEVFSQLGKGSRFVIALPAYPPSD